MKYFAPASWRNFYTILIQFLLYNFLRSTQQTFLKTSGLGSHLDPAFILAWEPPSPHQNNDDDGDDDDDKDNDGGDDDDDDEDEMKPDGAINPLQFPVYPQNDDRCPGSTCS